MQFESHQSLLSYHQRNTQSRDKQDQQQQQQEQSHQPLKQQHYLHHQSMLTPQQHGLEGQQQRTIHRDGSRIWDTYAATFDKRTETMTSTEAHSMFIHRKLSAPERLQSTSNTSTDQLLKMKSDDKDCGKDANLAGAKNQISLTEMQKDTRRETI